MRHTSLYLFILNLTLTPTHALPHNAQIYMHTPLHMACLYNQSRVVAELLKKLSSVEGSVCLPDKVHTCVHIMRANQLKTVTFVVGLAPPDL